MPAVQGRVASVDIVRGMVMVIMALDHVRDYFTNVRFAPEDVTQTSLALFFTRWITHLCAPAFVLLAGTGAGLSALAGKPLPALTRFLWTRGLWLIVAEVTVVRFGWTFNLDYANQAWLQVIWVLGVSMIVLAVLVHLPRWAIATFGLVMIAGHNLLDPIGLEATGFTLVGASLRDWIWALLHVQRIPIVYPLIPWIGVMAVGYAMAPWLAGEAGARERRLLVAGAAITAGFVVLRWLNLYGDPQPWSLQPRPGMTLVSFLNTQKYPPSLLYLMMTLGPALMMLALMDQARGAVARFFEVVGRVPFFYYVVHLYLIHLMVLAVAAVQGRPLGPFLNAFFVFPAEWGFGLPVVYALWVVAVALLYPLCRWFAGLKSRRRDLTWLSYL
jgi:uncharacterized membrane protein